MVSRSRWSGLRSNCPGVPHRSNANANATSAPADIVTRWTDAWHAGDVDAIVAMLAADARYSMPPLPDWYRGEDEIRAFLLRGPLQSRWRFLPATANGQLAFGSYMWDEAAGAYVPGGLDVLTLQDGCVAEVTAFLTADLIRFGLPARIRSLERIRHRDGSEAALGRDVPRTATPAEASRY